MSLLRFGFIRQTNANVGSQPVAAAATASPTAATGDIIRDPAIAALSIDNEIKLGPIVMQPDTKHSGRGFRTDWVATRPWLEYSSSVSKAFCFPCRLFSRQMHD
jgi:hypothetical protein